MGATTKQFLRFLVLGVLLLGYRTTPDPGPESSASLTVIIGGSAGGVFTVIVGCCVCYFYCKK